MDDIDLIAAEIQTDPLGRYTGLTVADAQAIADSLNAVDRAGPADREQVKAMIYERRHRSTNGTDNRRTNLFGRLQAVARGTVGQDVFGQGDLAGAEQLVAEDIHSAITLIAMCEDVSYPLNLRSNGLNNILADMVRAEVMDQNDRDAIQALSDNLQSRAFEIGIRKEVIPGDVVAAFGRIGG